MVVKQFMDSACAYKMLICMCNLGKHNSNVLFVLLDELENFEKKYNSWQINRTHIGKTPGNRLKEIVKRKASPYSKWQYQGKKYFYCL